MGILGIFYVSPYYYAAQTEVYRHLRECALAEGIATPEDLPGLPPPIPPEGAYHETHSPSSALSLPPVFPGSLRGGTGIGRRPHAHRRWGRGPDPADPNDPLSNYLDLSQLPAETVSAATQTLDLTSESNGCQAVLQKAVGDAMTLYLSVVVTYPEGVDLSASLPLAQTSGSGSYGTTSVVVTEGTVTDPGQMPAESDLEGLSGVGSKAAKWGTIPSSTSSPFTSRTPCSPPAGM